MEDADQPAQWLDSKHLSTPVLPSSHNGKIDVQDQLMFGWSIPVVWIQGQPESNKKSLQNPENAHESTKGNGVLGAGLLHVPDSSSESLSLAEHHIFLLALYIFGKNFHVVNKFMGNKGMQNVLSYYYGKFYKTGEHQKWLRYKKMKGNNKTIPGKNIFSDWRQEELFSCLFPHVTGECRTSLTQGSKMFEDGELSFETYVFSVRDIVGIDRLIESIGIGKGKRDLTSRAKKPVEKKILPHEYSYLTTEQIVNLLNHDNELNKEKLSELFWEAVWPRLLARGWHSEQTTNYAFQSSKNTLVFLAPGITKFSRRGLHKGIQYFESFKDVLNKVASGPQLLELEPIHDRPVSPPTKQVHMQFTIVDGVVRKCELRSMSDIEPTDMQESFSSGDSGETIQDSNSPPDSDGGEPLLPVEPFVFHETVTNQPKLPNPMDAGANTDVDVALNGQRQSTRKRLLTAKALEALATEYMKPKKKKTN
ncbi:hypothetical protein L2E82_00050 [Cichorium intybus]|uniref:Uncharacterized protein n=1 Tax=Cichorium intybus TaxID=13427 RepID=A0ACB9GVX5_CICIN|nr:hypothetical protein L2E82_00050 [Cichorium intybus]